jgi:hypothetical protein
MEVNPRHRPRLSSTEKAKEIGYLLDTEDDAQRLTWQQLALEVGIHPSEKTVQNTMNKKGFVSAIAKRRDGIPPALVENRVEQARGQLRSHPSWEDWKNVLFSDEVHFGWSDEGRIYIKRRIGAWSNPRHIQHPREPRDKDRKRFHC